MLHRLIEPLPILDSLPNAHTYHDLLKTRQGMNIRPTERFLQLRNDPVPVL
jgi:hypothetical protein